MNLKKIPLVLLLILAGTFSAAFSLQQEQAEAPVVRITQVDTSQFPRVTVYVSITDAAGNPLGIDPGRLSVLEDGERMTADSISGMGELQSVTTLLVIDISGSMDTAGKLPSAKAAAVRYIQQMRSSDQAGLISYDTKAALVHEISPDKDSLMSAVNGLQTGGDTAMYDALIEAETALEAVPGRKTIILLTDGLDNRSRHDAADVIDGIGPGGLSIFVIGLGNASQEKYLWTALDEDALAALAEDAGGSYSFVNDPQGLESLYTQLGRSLQSEFAIVYTSPAELRDGVKRALSVELRPEGSGEVIEAAAASYNPGGLIPEVPNPRNWGLFAGLMLLMLFLLILPSLVPWLKARALRRQEQKKEKKLKPIPIEEIKRIKLK